MKYNVIKRFKDTHDNNHIYEVGDKYPRKGRIDKDRVLSLSTKMNNCGESFIEEVGDK